MRNISHSEVLSRCFIALTPDNASRDVLASLDVPASARRVPHAQLHLTVAFIGALPVTQGKVLAERLREYALPLVPTTVTRIGCWPSRSRPRMMVASLAMTDGLATLDQRIRSLMTELGLPVEQRSFRPHITLARFARDASPVQLVCDAEKLPPVQFTSLVLYSSTLSPQGARYEALADIPLA